jgi:hypothetical protein
MSMPTNVTTTRLTLRVIVSTTGAFIGASYRIRFLDHPGEIGAQAVMEWQGEKWVIFGDVNRYNSSPRTKHDVYTVKRY